MNKTTFFPGMTAAVDCIRQIASAYGFSRVMTDESKQLYLRIYNLDDFKHKSIKNKIKIAGVCVYLMMRVHNWPITITYLCNSIGCSFLGFHSLFTKVADSLNIKVPTSSYEELFPQYFAKAGFNDEKQADTITLISIGQEAFLASGRQTEPMIVAAMYLIWLNSDYTKHKKTTMKQFCSTKNLPFRGASTKRLIELRKASLNIFQKVPWRAGSEATILTVVKYLHEILQYWKVVQNSKLSEKSMDDSEDEIKPPCLKKLRRDERNLNDSTLERKVWVPPLSHENSVMLTENDLAESELHEYIRTPKEVVELKKLAEVLEQMSNSRNKKIANALLQSN